MEDPQSRLFLFEVVAKKPLDDIEPLDAECVQISLDLRPEGRAGEAILTEMRNANFPDHLRFRRTRGHAPSSLEQRERLIFRRAVKCIDSPVDRVVDQIGDFRRISRAGQPHRAEAESGKFKRAQTPGFRLRRDHASIIKPVFHRNRAEGFSGSNESRPCRTCSSFHITTSPGDNLTRLM